GRSAVRLTDRQPGVLLPSLADNWQRRLGWLAEAPSRSETLSRLEATGSASRLSPSSRKQAPQREVVWVTDFAALQSVRGVALPAAESVEVLWCEPPSGAFLMRLRDPDDDELPYRIYAIDLRGGHLLNAAAAR